MSAPSRPADPASARERRSRQRTFWSAKYAEDPAFFGERESAFARWSVRKLRADPAVREVAELGSGYGRDTRFLAACGFRVRGVDLVAASEGPRGRRDGRSSGGATYVRGDALAFLRSLPAGGLDAVYSNLFVNMDFTEAEHRGMWRAVHRALRPGGWHLYSARSTEDPWYGRGRRMGADRYDPAPHGVTMHYFSRAYSDRLARGLFEPVIRTGRREGGREFPIRLLYVADRKPGRPRGTAAWRPSDRETASRRSRPSRRGEPRAPSRQRRG